MPFYLLCTLFVFVFVLMFIAFCITMNDADKEDAALPWAIAIVLWCVSIFPYVKAAW